MAPGSKAFDWRAVGAFVALLVGLLAVTGYITTDKMDSKIKSHAITTEEKHTEQITDIKDDIAEVQASVSALKKGQEGVEAQNVRILEKLDRLAER